MNFNPNKPVYRSVPAPSQSTAHSAQYRQEHSAPVKDSLDEMFDDLPGFPSIHSTATSSPFDKPSKMEVMLVEEERVDDDEEEEEGDMEDDRMESDLPAPHDIAELFENDLSLLSSKCGGEEQDVEEARRSQQQPFAHLQQTAPSLPDCFEHNTSVASPQSPIECDAAVRKAVNGLGYDLDGPPSPWVVQATGYEELESVRFRVSIFRHHSGSGSIIEYQRRSGSSFTSYDLYVNVVEFVKSVVILKPLGGRRSLPAPRRKYDMTFAGPIVLTTDCLEAIQNNCNSKYLDIQKQSFLILARSAAYSENQKMLTATLPLLEKSLSCQDDDVRRLSLVTLGSIFQQAQNRAIIMKHRTILAKIGTILTSTSSNELKVRASQCLNLLAQSYPTYVLTPNYVSFLQRNLRCGDERLRKLCDDTLKLQLVA